MVKNIVNPTLLKYNFYSFMKTWKTSITSNSIEFLINHLKNEGFNCEYNKFIGFYGVTKDDAIQYLRNSKPNLHELNDLTNKLIHHNTPERFADIYVNILENPLSLHLWEYYPGNIFNHDELNGFLLKVSEPEKKVNRMQKINNSKK